MTSAAVAVTLSARRGTATPATSVFGFGVTLVFVYTTIVNVVERPDGVKIACLFIAAIVVVSLDLPRWSASFELRVTAVVLDETARGSSPSCGTGPCGSSRTSRTPATRAEYAEKSLAERRDHHIPDEDLVLFLEVTVTDPSEFEQTELDVRGEERFGHRVLAMESTSVPNAIAALLLHVRDLTGHRPHVYFEWTEGNPLAPPAAVPPVRRRRDRARHPRGAAGAEPDPHRRPRVHVG